MALVNLLDAAWLYVESQDTPMHVAVLQIFTPPRGAASDYVGRMVAEFKSARSVAPLWSRKLSNGWVDKVLPSWTTDEHVDLDYHVRHSALPRPGGERELGVLVSRLHSHPLDMARPLWECHFIEGLAGRRFAVYMKMHHSLIDGVSGMRLLQRMLSADPGERAMPAPWAGEPSAPETPEGHGVDSLAEAFEAVSGAVREQADSLANVGLALLRLARGAMEPDDALVAPLTCPHSAINGRITPQRRFATQSVTLRDVKAIASAAGCTVNDVVLALCSAALRRYLSETGALPEEPLTAGLPVNIRAADDTGTGTAISFICANLATDVASAKRRIAAIRASTERAKEHLQDLPKSALTHYTVTIMAPYILQLLTGLGGRLRPVFNVTISNVPGPERPLYLNGAKLQAMYPVSLLSHGQALNITCLSYNGTLNFGFTGCRDTLPHMQRLAVYAGEAMVELKKVFGERRASRARR
jgi:WS/DGAT/MGAT family acyltransferase